MDNTVTVAAISAFAAIVTAYLGFRGKHEDTLSSMVKDQSDLIRDLKEQVVQFQVENKQLKETVDNQNKVIDNLTEQVGQLQKEIAILNSQTKEA
ncbi:DUF3450 domain-containing protein [Convivina praedatoris]|uniref:DUF3450 domain-containing protein n=1 Tax=Convivina praedatoris TaxID=2880963 RepID=UPI00200F59F7|nr:DUF3450 domain-containing protein [Convivina sp. LMG 32447]CAH1855091.1 hypothetical protein R078138_01057 [Convivina sp. LMG 32447]